jgi:hypothetical protein
MGHYKLSDWLRWLALAPASFFTALWLLFGVGEVLGGDQSGLIHLAPALLMIGLLVVAWKWGRLGGIAMLATGLVVIIYLLIAIENPASKLPGALLTGGPFLVSGLLFLLADLLKRSETNKTPA